jgi:hypothetical protein
MRSILLAGGIAGLFLARSPAFPSSQPKITPRPTLVAPGKLVLHNTTFDSVQVEVRLGPSESCDNNPPLGAYMVLKDHPWVISFDQVICWRRESNPNAPTGTWTSWSHQSVSPNDSVNVTL